MPNEEDYKDIDSLEETSQEDSSFHDEEYPVVDGAVPENDSSESDEPEDTESTEITDEERREQLKSIAEALIFASNEPLTEAQFKTVVGRRSKYKLAELVAELNEVYVREGRAFEILNIAKGYQFFTRPEFAHSLKKLFTERSKTRLSRAALESLAVVAFRGPVTRAEIDEIRGVESSGVIRTLLDRRLVQVKGRADVIGRPMLYETTEEFLRHFGLSSLEDLPKHHELNREWGELQEAGQASDDSEREDEEAKSELMNEFDEPEDDYNGDSAQHDAEQIDDPEMSSGEENGHKDLSAVNLENKPLDSEK